MTVWSDPADALQVGMYALLSADTTLAGLITGVYDRVPEDADPPFVVLGEMLSTEDSAHGSPGRQTVATLHTWAHARSFRTANQAAARMVALLARQQDELDPLVDGHVVYMIAHEFSQTQRDPTEPELRHRVDRFRIWTRQEE